MNTSEKRIRFRTTDELEYIDGLFGIYEKRFSDKFSPRLPIHKHYLSRIGSTFGKITVVEALGTSAKYGSVFGLRCACGVLIAHNAKSIFSGSSVSCGCVHKRNASTLHKSPARQMNIAEPGVVARKSTYSNYRSSAAKRGYLFHLTFEQFTEITRQPCYLCGSPPSNKALKSNSRGEFIYSGIDRVDNRMGYVKENCRPCCCICNSLKMSSTLDFTLSHMRKIISYQDCADLFI